MTSFAYLFLFAFFAILFEIIMRTFGFFLPLLAFLVFYSAVVFGPKTSFILAIAGGAVLDFVLGISIPISAISMTLVATFSLFWLYKVESDSILLLVVPGSIIPILAYTPLAFVAGLRGLYYCAPAIFFAICISAFLLPILILLFDMLNQFLKLPLYTKAKLGE